MTADLQAQLAEAWQTLFKTERMVVVDNRRGYWLRAEDAHEARRKVDALVSAHVAQVREGLESVRAIHAKTHWCFDTDEQAEVYERGTKFWPCPTLRAIADIVRPSVAPREPETHPSYYSGPSGHPGRREDCRICPPLGPREQGNSTSTTNPKEQP